LQEVPYEKIQPPLSSSVEYDEIYIPLVFAEKFAELIARECLAVCDSVEADEELPGLGNGALVCGIEIRAKFGIKE
jgi:hypothetical protein